MSFPPPLDWGSVLQGQQFWLRLENVQTVSDPVVIWCCALTGDDLASGERIAGVTRRTRADGIVAHHLADGLSAANAWARIRTLLIDAGLSGRALGIGNAFGTAFRRNAQIARQARTDRSGPYWPTVTVRPARRWIARLFLNRRFGRSNLKIKRKTDNVHLRIITPPGGKFCGLKLKLCEINVDLKNPGGGDTYRRRGRVGRTNKDRRGSRTDRSRSVDG